MGERLTRAQVAERQGVSRQRVDELINEGKLKEERATVDSDEVAALWATFDPDYVHRDRAGKALRAEKSAEKVVEDDRLNDLYNRAKTKMQALKAQDLELSLQIKRGAFVPKQLVTQQAYSAGKMLTTRLNGIARRLAPQLAVLVDPLEIEALLQKEVEEILKDVRDELSSVAGG